MDRTYTIHGLRLRSECPLPLPGWPSDSAADVTFRVELGEPELDHATFLRADDPEDPWATEHWLDGALVLTLPEWATFELTPDEIVLRVDDTGDPDLIAHLVLDHALPRVVALRGDLMLHAAGAIGPSGLAHIVLGPTGSGKSTLAAALAAHGWALIDDDGVRVTLIDGRPHAVPGAPSIRLLPTTADAVLGTGRRGERISSASDKLRYAIEGPLRSASGPARIGCVYLLDMKAPADLVEPIGAGEAIGAVATHGFHVSADPGSIGRKVFDHAVGLAGACRLLRLGRAAGVGRISDTVRALETIDSEIRVF